MSNQSWEIAVNSLILLFITERVKEPITFLIADEKKELKRYNI